MQQYVVQPRADDARGHDDQSQRERGVLPYAQDFFALCGREHRHQHADADQYAVPVHLKAADAEISACELHACPPIIVARTV